MFLESMTNEDLSRIFENEEDFYLKNVRRFSHDVHKAAKVKRPFPLQFYRSIKSENKNEYLLLSGTTDGKEMNYQTLAVMTSSSGAKLYSTIDTEDGDIKDRFTAHFVNRYSERFLKKKVSQELSLAIFFQRNAGRGLIYEKELEPGISETVFAMNDGVALAITNCNTGISTFNTFISDDLLGTSQRLAKEQILEALPKHGADLGFYNTIKGKELSAEAQSIYEQFFNEDATDYLVLKAKNEDDLKLNFKLSASEDKLKANEHTQKESIPSKVYIPVNENFSYYGTMTNSSGHIPTGKGTLKIGKDAKYTGELKNGLPHGKGVLKTEDAVYTGMFKDGYPCGKGKIETISGYIFEGTFKGDKLNGFGKQISTKDGTCYEGEFIEGEFQGKGRLTLNDGTIFEGSFKKGYFYRGKIISPDGNIAEGKMKNKKFDGMFKFTSPDGKISYGRFKNGELIQ